MAIHVPTWWPTVAMKANLDGTFRLDSLSFYPWYRGWQKDFGHRGLTIIGIHTPESQGERDVQVVREKMKSQGLLFPVVVDNTPVIDWQSLDGLSIRTIVSSVFPDSA